MSIRKLMFLSVAFGVGKGDANLSGMSTLNTAVPNTAPIMNPVIPKNDLSTSLLAQQASGQACYMYQASVLPPECAVYFPEVKPTVFPLTKDNVMIPKIYTKDQFIQASPYVNKTNLNYPYYFAMPNAKIVPYLDSNDRVNSNDIIPALPAPYPMLQGIQKLMSDIEERKDVLSEELFNVEANILRAKEYFKDTIYKLKRQEETLKNLLYKIGITKARDIIYNYIIKYVNTSKQAYENIKVYCKLREWLEEVKRNIPVISDKPQK